MANITCEECMFWKERPYRSMATLTEEKVIGECRRFPPSTDGHLTHFPVTTSIDWCGEGKKAKGKKEAKKEEGTNQ